MSKDSEKSCPACEYRRGNPGRPVARGDEIHCLSCGNSWKEYTNANSLTAIEAASKAPLFGRNSNEPVEEVVETIVEEPLHYPDFEPDYSKAQARNTGGFTVLAGIAAALILGVAGTLYTMQGLAKNERPAGLHVENIAFEEIVRQGGQKIVKVQGMLGNDGDETVPISRVAIVLRKANGAELTRWYHSSKVPLLKPGKKTGFVTAMAVNAPAIASVDAIVE